MTPAFRALLAATVLLVMTTAATPAQAAVSKQLFKSLFLMPLASGSMALSCSQTYPTPSKYVAGSGSAKMVWPPFGEKPWGKVTSQGPIANGYQASFKNNAPLAAQGLVYATCVWN